MKNRKFAYWFTVLLLVMLFSFSSAMGTLADISTPSGEVVDIDKLCSLQLILQEEGQVFPDRTVSIYRFADLVEPGKFALSPNYAGYPVSVQDISTDDEWKALAETIEGYVVADKKAPDYTGTTDQKGSVFFDNLKSGMYLIREPRIPENAIYCFDTYVLCLPAVDKSGAALYDVTTYPKPGDISKIPHDPGEDLNPDNIKAFRVVKQWKDSTGVNRPKEITVEIYCDDTLKDTVTLSAKDNWMYTWKASMLHRWLVVERSVSDFYLVSVDREDYAFYITNTEKQSTPQPPTAPTTTPTTKPSTNPSTNPTEPGQISDSGDSQVSQDRPNNDKPVRPTPYTGDSFNAWLWIALLVVSGVILMWFGSAGRKERHE